MFTGYGIHAQCMLGNLAQHWKSRSLSANQIGIMLMVNQQIVGHIIAGLKCVEKWNAVDWQSILNMKLIGDSKLEIKFDMIGDGKTGSKQLIFLRTRSLF